MKAYKGFNANMTCRGYQYKEGETYHEDKADLCNAGFHACENPLDCFDYYSPADSVYHEVELEDVSDETSSDSKRVGKTIKIGARLSIGKLVDASVEYINQHVDRAKKQHVNGDNASNTGYRSAASNTGYRSAASNTGNCSAASNTGDRSAASNTGYHSAASNTGNCSAASNTGDRSAASNTGYHSAASNTGYHSAASNTGDRSAASNTGNCSAASNTGDRSAASNTGDRSAASNTGNCSAASNTGDRSAASVSGAESVAMAIGRESKAKGALGCWITLAEWAEIDGEYHIVNVKTHRVDGKTIKPDVWYRLRNGKFVQAK